MTEYRVAIQVPGLPLEEPDSWELVVQHLETQPEDVGAVLSWDDPTTARFTLALQATLPQAAADIAWTMVMSALSLADRPYFGRPKVLDVQLVDVEAEDAEVREVVHRTKRD